MPGMVEALTHSVLSQRRPFLGICVGMQLLADQGLEHGRCAGLGWIPGDVVPIEPASDELKIPHMGWNQLINAKKPLFNKELENEFVYFVHSYYVATGSDTAAESHYIHPFSAALRKNNFFATQFHPEKSSKAGEQILRNFLEM